MSNDVEAVERWRRRVAEGHQAVSAGRYDEAVRAFAGALEGLTGALGADHPEVEELGEDLQAARSMGEMFQFGKEVGYRDWAGPTPEETDGDEGGDAP